MTPDPGDPPIPPDQEDDVKTEDLQTVLTAAGYKPGTIDGDYGPKTEAAWTAMMTDAARVITVPPPPTITVEKVSVVKGVTLG